jgi:hypothetical protein
VSFRDLIDVFARRFRLDTAARFSWTAEEDPAAPGAVMMTWSTNDGSDARTTHLVQDRGQLSWLAAPTGVPALWAARVTLSSGGGDDGALVIELGNPGTFGSGSTGRLDVTTAGASRAYLDGARLHTALTVEKQLVRATANLALTGVAQTVPGLQADIDLLITEGTFPPRSDDVVYVDAVADLAATAGATLAIAELFVDGVAEPGGIILDEGAVRATPGQHWELTGLAPGAHLLELRARKTGAGGTGTARAVQSVLKVEVLHA